MDNLRESWPKTGTDFGPCQLGPYRTGQELGRGFSSVVYEAVDSRQGRCVALKVLTFLPTSTEERRADLDAAWRPELPNGRIVERTAAPLPRVRRVTQVALASRPGPPAVRPLAPPLPSAPNPPAVPFKPAVLTVYRVQPVLAPTLAGVGIRPSVAATPAPVVRVAGSREELTPDIAPGVVPSSAPPKTEAVSPSDAQDENQSAPGSANTTRPSGTAGAAPER